MKKNITKAIKIADYLIDIHIRHANGIEEHVKDWTTNSKDLGLEIAATLKQVAQCIEVIKELLVEKPRKRKIK